LHIYLTCIFYFNCKPLLCSRHLEIPKITTHTLWTENNTQERYWSIGNLQTITPADVVQYGQNNNWYVILISAVRVNKLLWN
jgi:hypothetical protein